MMTTFLLFTNSIISVTSHCFPPSSSPCNSPSQPSHLPLSLITLPCIPFRHLPLHAYIASPLHTLFTLINIRHTKELHLISHSPHSQILTHIHPHCTLILLVTPRPSKASLKKNLQSCPLPSGWVRARFINPPQRIMAWVRTLKSWPLSHTHTPTHTWKLCERCLTRARCSSTARVTAMTAFSVPRCILVV